MSCEKAPPLGRVGVTEPLNKTLGFGVLSVVLLQAREEAASWSRAGISWNLSLE